MIKRSTNVQPSILDLYEFGPLIWLGRDKLA